jgi:hypothetical protein
MCQSSAHTAEGGTDPALGGAVWLRVGKTLLRQAVFRPAAVMPRAARKPAPPPPTTTTS